MFRSKIWEAFISSPRVCTDTRKIQKGDIYFALKGDSFNGNDFLQLALDAGAAWAVGDEERIKNDRFILVENALSALQELAQDYRRSWHFPVLSITGSNGKTTTKELVRDVLATQFKVHATRGNLNNHIGIPLTILETPNDTELAIIEMGANHQKEIESYCQYAQPTHGLITNIGKAHLEGFGGIEGVQRGKRELYDYLLQAKGTIFCNAQQDYMHEWANIFHPVEYSANDFVVLSENEGMDILWTPHNIRFHSHLAGRYNLNNVAAALKIGEFFGVSPTLAAQAIANYIPQNMRSQILKTEWNELIIDAYNANPTSLEHAIRNLADQKGLENLAIIGAMKEMGEFEKVEHERIVQCLQDLKIKSILVGKEFDEVRGNFEYYPTVEELIQVISSEPLRNKRILIKGSRGVRLEKVLPFL